MGDILFLAHRVPFPPDRGDKIRGYHLLRHLSAQARVHLVAFADDRRDLDTPIPADLAATAQVIWRGKPQPLAAAQALATGRPVSLTAFASASLRAAVDQVLANCPIDTIVVFSGQMAQYLPVRTTARVVMDFVDMDSAKFAAYAADARGPLAWMLAREARLLEHFETQVAARADASLFVSEAEAALFRARTGASRVHAIENGIDTAFYDPAGMPPPEAPLIVFTGQMDYRPNIEGVTWFAQAILPRIRQRHPQASFVIVGRSPPEAVQALARQPGITVTGEVPDVRIWLARAAVAVAPLKLARGIQNKVLEAMAMARPVVASSAAAEGIDHAGTLRVGADTPAIATAVADLLADPETAAALGTAARRQVIARYGWDARLAPLDALLNLPAQSIAA
jgi:polysaccharide biosynthesis protein PslH